MKQIIQKVEESIVLYKDTESGLAWIDNGKTGNRITVHANISDSGSVKGMKNAGYWNKKAKTLRNGGYIYNIDTFVCNENDELEVLVASACMCEGCKKRKRDK